MAISNRGCGKFMRNFDRFILELLNFLELFLFETKQTTTSFNQDIDFYFCLNNNLCKTREKFNFSEKR